MQARCALLHTCGLQFPVLLTAVRRSGSAFNISGVQKRQALLLFASLMLKSLSGWVASLGSSGRSHQPKVLEMPAVCTGEDQSKGSEKTITWVVCVTQ